MHPISAKEIVLAWIIVFLLSVVLVLFSLQGLVLYVVPRNKTQCSSRQTWKTFGLCVGSLIYEILSGVKEVKIENKRSKADFTVGNI